MLWLVTIRKDKGECESVCNVCLFGKLSIFQNWTHEFKIAAPTLCSFIDMYIYIYISCQDWQYSCLYAYILEELMNTMYSIISEIFFWLIHLELVDT